MEAVVVRDKDLEKVVLDIVESIDYDIYKGAFIEETAEYPEDVQDNIDRIAWIILRSEWYRENK